MSTPDCVTKTIQHGNCTIVIHRPDLTKTERTRRELAVMDALEAIYKKQIHSKTED